MNCPRKSKRRGGRTAQKLAIPAAAAGLLAVLLSWSPPAPARSRAQTSAATAASKVSQAKPPTLQGPPPQDPRARIRTTVSLVVVPVTVKDGSGELVSDLQQSDFRILEDGVEQPIAVFSAEAFPLSAAVLIDDDLKRGTAERVQKTLETVAAGFSPADEVSLWRFDEVPQLISEFVADNDTLLAQLKKIDLSSSFPGVGSAPMTSGPRVNTQSPTGPPQRSAMSIGHPNNKHIDDAIFAAAEQLRDRPRDRRKIIVLISDGQNAKNNTHHYDETLKALLSADISVYAVGTGEANYNRGITFLGNNVLAKYAHATGGDMFYGSSRQDLEGLYARVSEQARNQYTLAYSAANTDRSQPYHGIEVRARRPGLNILTRDGYYLGTLP